MNMYLPTPSGAPLIDEAGATNETFNSWKAADLRVWATLSFPKCRNEMNGGRGLNQLPTMNISVNYQLDVSSWAGGCLMLIFSRD